MVHVRERLSIRTDHSRDDPIRACRMRDVTEFTHKLSGETVQYPCKETCPCVRISGDLDGV